MVLIWYFVLFAIDFLSRRDSLGGQLFFFLTRPRLFFRARKISRSAAWASLRLVFSHGREIPYGEYKLRLRRFWIFSHPRKIFSRVSLHTSRVTWCNDGDVKCGRYVSMRPREIRSTSARDSSSDVSDQKIIWNGGSVAGEDVRRDREDLAGVHGHHRGRLARLASPEFRMAAWRAPLRGVDWTAPHPAINKLAEREQPRDEPFNSATFCLPPLLCVSSSPLAITSSPLSPCPVDDSPAVLCSSTVTLAISDSARAPSLRSATR